MKKSSHMPDFHKLCAPAQNHIADTVSLEIFFFFLGAFCGFLWEVLLVYIETGSYVNRGFFHGPWLPIYGAGAVIFHLLLGASWSAEQDIFGESICSHSTDTDLDHNTSKFSLYPSDLIFYRRHKYSILRVLVTFLLCLLLGTSLELIIGWFLDTVCHLRYWDYSNYPMNFHGYIWLGSAIGFGIAGALWVCFFSNFIAELFFQLSAKKRRNLNTILLLLFVLDCAASFIFPNTGHGITFQ